MTIEAFPTIVTISFRDKGMFQVEFEKIIMFLITLCHFAKLRLGKLADKVWSLKFLYERLPILRWITTYSLEMLLCDLIAGLSTALTVIPQGRVLHLDVEVRSEELLAPALLCHTEPTGSLWHKRAGVARL